MSPRRRQLARTALPEANGGAWWANPIGRCYIGICSSDRTDFADLAICTAMSFNALDRNPRPQAIWALGDDWRCWRRS